MSTPLAIAAVTAVLKDLLNTGMTAADVSSIVGDVKVSARPPDRLVGNGDDPTAINLFLYQVTPNQGWRNVGLPTRGADGSRTGNAPLALDLHYLLTATGAKDFWPEIVMGYAMQMLHETGVLSRTLIQRALSPTTPPPDFPAPLALSELADQVEQIKITPAALTIDDISKLWTGFQGRYRLSAAYLVTVVLIQTDRSTRSSLPVATRNIAVRPFERIVIDSIAAEDDYPKIGSVLRITGENLSDPHFALFIDGVDQTGLVTESSAKSVTLTLLAPPGSALRAGVCGVQIFHPVEFAAGILRAGNQSNLMPFVLHPVVIGSHVGGTTLTLTLDPKVTRAQRVMVLLNSGAGPSYSFAVASGNGIVDPAIDIATVSVDVSDVAAGTYLVRVTVDGASSPLGMNGMGVYDSPAVVL